MLLPAIANKLKGFRQERDLSVTQVARYLDVSRQTIYNWENGSAEPSIDHLSRLLDFYHVTLTFHFEKQTQ